MLATRIHQSFDQQQVMKLLDAKLIKITTGEVHIELPYDPKITQQNGYVHAGIITTVIDSACGYAAFSLMPPDSGVLAVEFKVNFLSPAKGEKFVAIGKVIKAGRTLTICSGEMHAINDSEMKLVALMQATMIALNKDI
jgi:uncharacterized protein (TIGR00369 family)